MSARVRPFLMLSLIHISAGRSTSSFSWPWADTARSRLLASNEGRRWRLRREKCTSRFPMQVGFSWIAATARGKPYLRPRIIFASICVGSRRCRPPAATRPREGCSAAGRAAGRRCARRRRRSAGGRPGWGRPGEWAPCDNGAAARRLRPGAVSYTHLDVYKRQPLRLVYLPLAMIDIAVSLGA